jgi:hypothetical protein
VKSQQKPNPTHKLQLEINATKTRKNKLLHKQINLVGIILENNPHPNPCAI